jgi:gas vesicle protein
MHNHNSDNGLKSLFTGLIIGGLLGILFAPKKGSETRQELREKLNERLEDIENRGLEIRDDITEGMDTARMSVVDGIEGVVEEVKGRVSEVRDEVEGKVEQAKRTADKQVERGRQAVQSAGKNEPKNGKRS